MQPHVHAQPRVRVIVTDVKCYNIIQPQHVKCKQNSGWAKYCTFVLENTERRKPKNRGKSRKACHEMTLPIPPPQMSCVICIFSVVDAATISMRPKFTSSLERKQVSILFGGDLPRLERWWLGRELRIRRLSECEFVSGSCCRLCLHSLQLEDMPQFLAM